MKLSDIKSGMVLEVLDGGELERLLVSDINGELKAFNTEYSIGDISYWFDDNLNDGEVRLLSVYKIVDDERPPLVAIKDDNSLELIYTREYDAECDREEIQRLESTNEQLRREISLLRQIVDPIYHVQF